MKTTQSYALRTILLLLLCIFYSSTIVCPPATKQTKATQKKSSLNSLFTPTMSTTSINESAIDAVYGKKGLNIDAVTITQIQQTYAYIEMIVKSQKIARDPSLSKDKTFFTTIIASNKNSSAVIINSKEWKSIPITPADIQTSDFWQLYLKATIVDYYENQHDFIETMSMIQGQIFPYLAGGFIFSSW